MKTFLVGSLFKEEYIAVCSDKTGEIIEHIGNDVPVMYWGLFVDSGKGFVRWGQYPEKKRAEKAQEYVLKHQTSNYAKRTEIRLETKCISEILTGTEPEQIGRAHV